MSNLDPKKLPNHVAIIMDGNGRWAKKQKMSRIQGHQEGAESVREIIRTSREIGIPWLTLYAFSEENWKRPRSEIAALMALLKRFIKSELNEMMENGIRFHTIGRTSKLPLNVQKAVNDAQKKTAKNTDMTLTLALSYGARQEVVDGIRQIAKRVSLGDLKPEDITEDMFSGFLYTRGMPDPDLLIRTSGEYRVSNFLLWQLAYAELYITPIYWPDFRKEDYLKALEAYQVRERRYGATSEQLGNTA
jgi:undecaprenyl diphosphate synthase